MIVGLLGGGANARDPVVNLDSYTWIKIIEKDVNFTCFLLLKDQYRQQIIEMWQRNASFRIFRAQYRDPHDKSHIVFHF